MFFTSLLVAALVSVAQAQTPKGFTPSVNTQLDVIFNSTAVSEPGKLLQKGTTASQPQIALAGNSINSSATYMFVMMDLDVPPMGSGNATRRVLLHALNTGFKATSQKVGGTATLLTSTDKGPATYLSPSPPATDTIPHRYVELLFAQPASLKLQASDFANTQSRMGFDINAFMKTNQVSNPLAANFFTVDGKANPGMMGTASSSGAMPKNTVVPFRGSAATLDMSMGLAGVLGGLVLAAV